jgi:hypothetical protein
LAACNRTAPTQHPEASPARPNAGTAADASPTKGWSTPWDIESTAFEDLVPANAAIVLVNEGPLPEEALLAFEPLLTPLLDGAYASLQTRRGGRPLDFIGPTLDADDLRRMGIDPNPRLLVYVYGVAPVVRVSLRDPEKVEAVFRENPNSSSIARNFHGQEFWELPPSEEDDDEFPMQVVAAINGGDLVFAGIPMGYEEELLPLIFGQKLPKDRLWDTDFVGRAGREFGLLPHYLLRVNVRRILELATNSAGGRDQAIANALGLEVDDEACAPDIVRVSDTFPAAYWGFRGFSEQSVESAFVVELDQATAAAVAELGGPIPGMTEDREPNESLAAGVAFDFAGVESLFALWEESIRQRPFECEEFAGLNGLTQGVSLLATAPVEFRTFTGGSASVFDLEKTERGGGRVHAVVGFDDALEALSGSLGSTFGLMPGQVKRRKVTPLADAAPHSAISRDMPGAKITRSRRSIALGTDSTPNAALIEAAARQRPDDGALVVARWDLKQFLAAPGRAFVPEDPSPWLSAFMTAFFSLVERGSLTLRAKPSALQLDISLNRPRAH